MKTFIFQDVVTTTDTVWTVKQLCEYADQGLVVFNNAVQRGDAWDVRRDSLLIHSVIVNFTPPEFLANKKDGIYDMIDGRQRRGALSRFIENKYRLLDVPNLIAADGSEYELNGKFFSELLESVQDKITGRGLKISVMDNASQEVVREYFYRRNNGVQLTAARKTFSKAASFDEIAEMAKHPIFSVMFPKNNSDESTGVVMKSYVLLNCEMKSLENKKVFAYIKRAKFTEGAVNEVLATYDMILEANGIISSAGTRGRKKIAKVMLKKTHMIALVAMAKHANDNGIDSKRFAEWISHFFTGKDAIGATISDIYNENTSTGTAKEPAVKARICAMMDDFISFIGD